MRLSQPTTRVRAAIGAAILAGGIAAFAGSSGVTAQEGGVQAWYTEEQAERGWRIFFNNCAGCHGREVPAKFMGYANAERFFDFISENMPYDGGTRLAPQEYVDIVAVVMRQVGFPAGATELPVDPVVLAQIIPAAAPGPDPNAAPGAAPAVVAPVGGQAAAAPGPEAAVAQAPATPAAAPATPAGDVAAFYTEAQATEGERRFTTACGGCHNTEVMKAFFLTYPDAAAFYDRIYTTMPADQPGALPPRRYVEIITYIMHELGFPAGTTELTPDEAALAQIIPAAAPTP